MQISYHEADDILFIKFNEDKIVREVSYGWNVNISYTENGIGEITILDAKADGLLPIVVDKASAAQIAGAA
ncbi:MAG: DUF2283 domain-containing protein [Candidatus Competibacteraceae bacterium]